MNLSLNVLKKIVFVMALSLCGIRAYAGPDKCAQHAHKPEVMEVLELLADHLMYDFKEFCEHDRILDIYQVPRDVFMPKYDKYHPHIAVTLHYNEYSCEYEYNLVLKDWGRQHCYNTF